MLNKLDLSKILFLDIETVSIQSSYQDLSESFKALWNRKAQLINRSVEPITPEIAEELYWNKAGIFAEFGKIICISVGVLIIDKKTRKIDCRVKSFKSDVEKELLNDFCEMVVQYYNDPDIHTICGHNIKEFDIPYICRRLIVNQMPLPHIFNIPGRKPWETQFLLDTMTLWKFGDYKHFTSLKLLTEILDIPSPKEDIDGSDVNKVYWEDKDLDRIAAYCEKDVLAVVQLLFRFKGMPLLKSNQVRFI
ncbi:MAG: ribonuclease H-like domain-containing protein [Bacteroidia bacterium]|nr:ribonuclease H-like domain-containing protein [Bacteroidia bacterium]